eukprot:m.205009 g.205009  ORF g.205009 m.205009 type:complete len:144 (-) comp17754_c0_seq1:423-854(-)
MAARQAQASGQTVVQTTTEDAPTTIRLHLTQKKESSRRIQWRDDTVDNENLNKRSSKSCCIFKKARAFDESSSDDSGEEGDNKNCYFDRKTDGKKMRHRHHDHDHGCGGDHDHDGHDHGHDDHGHHDHQHDHSGEGGACSHDG